MFVLGLPICESVALEMPFKYIFSLKKNNKHTISVCYINLIICCLCNTPWLSTSHILEMWSESLVQLDKLFHKATWNSFENFSPTFLFYTFKAGVGSHWLTTIMELEISVVKSWPSYVEASMWLDPILWLAMRRA